MNTEWIEARFNVDYECKFCGDSINYEELESHQDACRDDLE